MCGLHNNKIWIAIYRPVYKSAISRHIPQHHACAYYTNSWWQQNLLRLTRWHAYISLRSWCWWHRLCIRIYCSWSIIGHVRTVLCNYAVCRRIWQRFVKYQRQARVRANVVRPQHVPDADRVQYAMHRAYIYELQFRGKYLLRLHVNLLKSVTSVYGVGA